MNEKELIEIRLECLRLSNGAGGSRVTDAKLCEEFVLGKNWKDTTEEPQSESKVTKKNVSRKVSIEKDIEVVEASPFVNPTSAIIPAIADIELPDTNVTYDDVKNIFLEVSKLKGRDIALDILQKFGVVSGEGDDRKGNIKNLKPEQYSEVVKTAKKVLEQA